MCDDWRLTMGDFLARAWDQMAGRLEGPLLLRFVLQPVVATFLAVRAGLSDARAQRAPYLWSVLSEPSDRRQLIREGWKDVRKVFTLAILLDCVYQFLVFRWVYPVQAVIIATVLAIVPYALVRGPATRAARRAGRG
jgi:hypothetical protein